MKKPILIIVSAAAVWSCVGCSKADDSAAAPVAPPAGATPRMGKAGGNGATAPGAAMAAPPGVQTGTPGSK